MIRILPKEEYEKIVDIGKIININFSVDSISEDEIINVFEDCGKVLGFIQYKLLYETLEIINIAVKKEFQNKKIGTSLLNSVLDLGESHVLLEVNENNKGAIEFYKKNGFKTIRVIKNYYLDGDGYSMERIL